VEVDRETRETEVPMGKAVGFRRLGSRPHRLLSKRRAPFLTSIF
jgi:hypothetical protein